MAEAEEKVEAVRALPRRTGRPWGAEGRRASASPAGFSQPGSTAGGRGPAAGRERRSEMEAAVRGLLCPRRPAWPGAACRVVPKKPDKTARGGLRFLGNSRCGKLGAGREGEG